MVFLSSFKSAILVNAPVTMASEVHLNAYASRSFNTNLLDCILFFDTTSVEHQHNYDQGTLNLPSSAN